MSQAEQELDALFDYIRQPPSTPTEWGRSFEILIRDFLKNDGAQKNQYEEVLLWDDFADKYGEGEPDTGIDIVAKGVDGSFTAIQCKFYDEDNSITRASTNSFFSLAGIRYNDDIEFTHKILAVTTEKLSKHLEDYITKAKTVKLIKKRDLAESNIDWKAYLKDSQTIKYRQKFALRKHQNDAVEKTLAGFAEANEGRLIMACGTGKTLTGLRFIEQFLGSDSLVLVAMPSIALISQTIREYCHQSWDDDIYPIAVCSQQQKREVDEEDMQLRDLLYPTSTEPNEIAYYVKNAEKGKRCVVFTTYQSMKKIELAQRDYGLGDFDLIIADEAHRSAGTEASDKNDKVFGLIHDRLKIKGEKRLYMTATPRVYSPSSQKRAKDDNILLYSMDNEEIFGKVFYELGFGKAVQQQLLSDYKVFVTIVDDRQALDAINSINSIVEEDGQKSISIKTKDAAKMIGIHKAIAKIDLLRALKEQGTEEPSLDDWEDIDTEPMKRVINFTPKIKHSEQVESIFPYFRKAAGTNLNVGVQHIDGTMTSIGREKIMKSLRELPVDEDCRMLTNAKCLTEGVDVPSLDGVCFFSKKKSFVDIIQAIGRVLRKSEGKEYGYIILPVCIPADQINDVDFAIRNNEDFEVIWQVIGALKAHDKALVDEADYRKKIAILDFSGTEEERKAKAEQKAREKAEKDAVDEKISEQLGLPLAEEIFNAIVDVAGESAFWKFFGEDVKKVVDAIELRLRDIVANGKGDKGRFESLLESFQKNIQKNINEDMLFSTLSQHLVTEPIFDALFSNSDFVKQNAIALALNNFLLDIRKDGVITAELEDLDFFYQKVKQIVKGKKQDKRDELIEGFYNSFITTAFPKLQKQLGIVYTPKECINFILNSTEALLQKHFETSISEENVSVLDPFTGMASFIVRLLDKKMNLIKDQSLLHKYQNEIHANEIILLAYYVALLRIETAFNNRHNGDYVPFQNAIFGDTFDSRTQGDLAFDPFKEVGDKWEKQSKQKITVIMGNPPYSSGQNNEMDDNKNAKHFELEQLIRESYVKESIASSMPAVHDSYIKALRWSSDRIQDKGMISFIINGSFIDSKTGSGIRACFGEEFSHIYIMNLKGNTRKKGEEVKKEGGKIFDGGSRATIAIIFLIKDGTQNNGIADIQYFEIDDYLDREQKLKLLQDNPSIENIETEKWQPIKPNKNHSWINQENENFEKYLLIGEKKKKKTEYKKSLFSGIYTIGFATNRDVWATNFSKKELAQNMQLHIQTYSDDLWEYIRSQTDDIEKIITKDKTKIKYTDSLLKHLNKKVKIDFDEKCIRNCLYLPFQRKYNYYSKELIHCMYRTSIVMPNDDCENIFICTPKNSNPNEFFGLATNVLPSNNIGSAGQCFPLYYYEEEETKRKPDLSDIANDDMVSKANLAPKLQKKQAITEWALEAYRKQYNDDSITRIDIFHYIYGIFHSPQYKKDFANNLRKDKPRIPFVKGKKLFQQFSEAGKKLMKLHLNYESAKLYKVDERIIKKDLLDEATMTDKELYKLKKMKFGKGNNKTTIIYNDFVSISGIPLKAYDYMIDGYSAIEWIMKSYKIMPPKDEDIAQDPNEYSEDPKYIFNLLKRIITVSIETMEIVESLPKLDIDEKSEFYDMSRKF